MSFAFILGRFCARSSTRILRHHASSPTGGWYQRIQVSLRPPPTPWKGARIGLRASAAAALGTATFVELSHEKNRDAQDTAERRMLETSQHELDTAARDTGHGVFRIVRQVTLFLHLYIWEPLCTGARFLHLVAIFVPVIITIPVAFLGPRQPDRDNERSGTLWWYGFLVESMEWAGPAFIKLGQWAASRTDIFPLEMCDTMSRLHSNAPAHPMRVTRETVEAAFGGRAFEDIFEEFNETPLGVGAIAQVYKAKLKPDLAAPQDHDIAPQERRPLSQSVRQKVGSVLKSTPQRVPSNYVAVKVLHPGVERTVTRDLKIMGFFAAVLNAIPTIEWLSLPDEVAQFGEMMKLQLDLRIEAANLERFRQNFKHRSTAWFPYPYSDFTTRNVLVEEYAQGIPLAAFLENGAGVFQHDIANEGLDAFLRMLILDNFIHADLHPGNIMVRFYQPAKPDLNFRARNPSSSSSSSSSSSYLSPPSPSSETGGLDVTENVLERLRLCHRRGGKPAWDAELAKIDAEGYRPQLILVDTGLVTELSATNRANFLALFRAIAEFDGYKAGRLMCRRCRQPDAVVDEDVFALRMQHLVLGVKSRTLALGNIRIGDLLQQVLFMVRRHHVRLEGDFVNVVISILLLEGIGRKLNPDLDLLSSALPILRQLSARGGAEMAKHGDYSMLLVWMGLETRRFLQASVEDVERCVKADLLSPNI
ncbi:ABC1 family protein [Escovopsis weberi]|uniref:ABC1 family protein n=1 Tax=Escovopsis weberi TaxID=150374 RepID=A0A0M8MZI8_ESCWE|nr:ABC1 family protein [Escovopsis weberi]